VNKYFIIGGIILLILIAGVVYRARFLPEELKPVATGKTREITVVASKNRWVFDPDVIEVNRGDKVILTLINEDDYDHGIAIDAFGIAQRMPAGETIILDFVVTQEGEFPFYCSIPCGEGIVEGEKRTHFDMLGKIQVRSIAETE
jgi:plastocyanin